MLNLNTANKLENIRDTQLISPHLATSRQYISPVYRHSLVVFLAHTRKTLLLSIGKYLFIISFQSCIYIRALMSSGFGRWSVHFLDKHNEREGRVV